ncbi:MAG TPA: helix-turn-helix domain-containing protein [Candidatus Magasanikbacteria bacterium]|nr:helix-turn-helix domain-containing protein [Candidatus Magasanikbacteria bacterium]
MAVFCHKKLNTPEYLGAKFKKTREEKNLTLEDMVGITHIDEKYLIAIENGKYNLLPKTKAHRFAYIREYCQALELDCKEFLNQFKEETRHEKISSDPSDSYQKYYLTSVSIFLRNLFIILAVLAFFTYIGFQINGVLTPPKLLVLSPVEGQSTDELIVMIQGEAEKESRLTVNGKEIMLNEKGQFESLIDLSEGLNTIIISATKKHGKTTTVIRHVVAKNNLQ